jgi:hypothetical protein
MFLVIGLGLVSGSELASPVLASSYRRVRYYGFAFVNDAASISLCPAEFRMIHPASYSMRAFANKKGESSNKKFGTMTRRHGTLESTGFSYIVRRRIISFARYC